MNKKIINHMPLFVRTMTKLRGYCSMLQKFDTFSTSNKAPFLCLVCQMCQIFGIWHICCGCSNKVKLLLWRAYMDSFPTMSNLFKKKNSSRLYLKESETILHTLWTCEKN